MIVQIFSITTVEQAVKCAELGVDHVGMRVGTAKTVPWELSYTAGKEIVDVINGRAQSVVITASNNLEEIIDIASNLKPHFIQTLAHFEELTLEDRRIIKEKLSKLNIKVTNGLPLVDKSSITLGHELAKVTDVIILETVVKTQNEMGATGQLNDWDLAAKLISEVNIPIIMSGGLGPENVKECIKKVKSWGVDSMTKTDVLGSNHMQKDFDLIRQFVSNAKN